MKFEIIPFYEPNWATFRIASTNIIIVSNAVQHLELSDVFVEPLMRGNGCATVLMICALEWAMKYELKRLFGVYNPRGNILKTEKWYKEIGANINKGSVTGDIQHMHDQCLKVRYKYHLDYTLMRAE